MKISFNFEFMQATPELLALINDLPDEYYPEMIRSIKEAKHKLELIEIHKKIRESLKEGIRPAGVLFGKIKYTADCFTYESEDHFELD